VAPWFSDSNNLKTFGQDISSQWVYGG